MKRKLVATVKFESYLTEREIFSLSKRLFDALRVKETAILGTLFLKRREIELYSSRLDTNNVQD